MKISNDEKKQVWDAYQQRRPIRVPVRWNTNPRIVLLNPRLNPEDYTFQQYSEDPQVLMTVQSRWQEHLATTLSATCDTSSDLPEQWNFYVDNQNTYDGAYFGAPVVFEAGNCPSNLACLTADQLDEFLARDFRRPLENPWIKRRLAFHAELTKAAQGFSYLGRSGKVAPFGLGFDGPLTVAAVLMGEEIFLLLGEEPERAFAFMTKITEAAMARNRALAELSGGWKKPDWGWLADDSIQLISSATFAKWVLPLHARWYDKMSATTAASKRRSIHLCGDATRHFPMLHQRLGVVSFDTGFPVDHGQLRRALGPEVEISGGPHAGLLEQGNPEQCAQRAREILQSGIMEGGRFILQEGNNLPPNVPIENLQAVYDACLEFGRYG